MEKQCLVCRRCGDLQSAPGDWAGTADIVDGQPVPGGMGLCGDLHDWVDPQDLLAPSEPVRR